MKTEAARCSETLEQTHHPESCNNSKDHNLNYFCGQIHRDEGASGCIF